MSFVPCLSLAEKIVWPIRDVLSEAKLNTRIVVKGKIKKRLGFDYFVIGDETGELVLLKDTIRPNLRVGDEVVIMGIYEDSEKYSSYEGQIDIVSIAKPTHEKGVKKLIQKYGRERSPRDNPGASIENRAAEKDSVEKRLLRLETLKNKNLITTEEYKEHRQRILNEL